MPASGPGSPPRGDDPVHRGGVGQGPLAVDGHEGVVGGVELGDAVERGLGQLGGADGAAADLVGQLRHGGGAEVHQLADPEAAAEPAPRTAADGDSPATTSGRSTPKGMTARAGMVTPLST